MCSRDLFFVFLFFFFLKSFETVGFSVRELLLSSLKTSPLPFPSLLLPSSRGERKVGGSRGSLDKRVGWGVRSVGVGVGIGKKATKEREKKKKTKRQRKGKRNKRKKEHATREKNSKRTLLALGGKKKKKEKKRKTQVLTPKAVSIIELRPSKTPSSIIELRPLMKKPPRRFL